jgi:ATP-dependent Clp protease ATP-binding subunit ClpA
MAAKGYAMDPHQRAVKDTLAAAAYEAALTGAHEIRSEHVWAALLRRPESVIGRTLAELGVSTGELLAEVNVLVHAENSPDTAGERVLPDVGLSVEMQHALRDAERSAIEAGDRSPSLKYLYVALLNDSSGPMKEILTKHGITAERVKQAIRTLGID